MQDDGTAVGADLSHQLRVACGGDLGQIAVLASAAGSDQDAWQLRETWGSYDRQQAVSHLASLDAAEPGSLAVARHSGQLEFWDAGGQQTGSLTLPLADSTVTSQSSQLVSLDVVPCARPALQLMACSRQGQLHVISPADDQSGLREWGSQQWKLPNQPTCAAVHSTQPWAATGFEKSMLRVWDLSTQQATYSPLAPKGNRKQAPHDPYASSLAFLGQDCVVVGLRKHALHVYDMRAGKRPAFCVDWEDSAVTALAPEASGLHVWAANGLGRIQALDMRQHSMQGALKGAVGSVRALQLDESTGLLAAAGLDRFVRLHCTRTRQLRAQVYVKQQVTALAFQRCVAPLQPAPAPTTPALESASEAAPQQAGPAAEDAGSASSDEEAPLEEQPQTAAGRGAGSGRSRARGGKRGPVGRAFVPAKRRTLPARDRK